jgi:CubicO group peptidase (beta-lactamase class C family)
MGVGYGYQWWIGKIMISNQTIEVLFASGHGGQKIFIIPGLDLVAVFTSRVFNPDGHSGPERFLLDYVIPSMLPPGAQKEAVSVARPLLDEVVGKYRSDELAATVPVFREGDKLYARTSLLDKFELVPQSDTRFLGRSRNAGTVRVHFLKNDAGEVVRLMAYFGLRGIRFKKIE